MVVAERARRVLGEGVAVALAVGGPHERGDDLEIPLGDLTGLAPEIGEAEIDVELQQVDARGLLGHAETVEIGVGRTRLASVGEIRFGPSGLPDLPSFEDAAAWLAAEGFGAVEIGFVSGFWLSYDDAPELASALSERDIVVSVHAPLAAFMGHVEREKKFKMALGMLDHTAGLAKAVGAEVIVFHPGFLLGRDREQTIHDVVDQLGDLRARLEAKDRLVPFGIEVMGRVRDFGSIDDVIAISRRSTSCGP